MANPEHLALLKQGAEAWNEWRQANQGIEEPDLSEALFCGADLSGANLRRANLRRANLGAADLSGANLRRVNLGRANLGAADLSEVRLLETIFSDVNLA